MTLALPGAAQAGRVVVPAAAAAGGALGFANSIGNALGRFISREDRESIFSTDRLSADLRDIQEDAAKALRDFEKHKRKDEERQEVLALPEPQPGK